MRISESLLASSPSPRSRFHHLGSSQTIGNERQRLCVKGSVKGLLPPHPMRLLWQNAARVRSVHIAGEVHHTCDRNRNGALFATIPDEVTWLICVDLATVDSSLKNICAMTQAGQQLRIIRSKKVCIDETIFHPNALHVSVHEPRGLPCHPVGFDGRSPRRRSSCYDRRCRYPQTSGRGLVSDRRKRCSWSCPDGTKGQRHRVAR